MSGISRDKTMTDKQNNPFCRLKLLIWQSLNTTSLNQPITIPKVVELSNKISLETRIKLAVQCPLPPWILFVHVDE